MRKNNNLKIIPFKRTPDFYFRLGVRYVDRKLYGIALKYLTRAAEMEPFNVDYQFNLACVLAELKQGKKSNGILMDILKNIDPKLTECYFGIACNHFDMGDFKKAREYFEKYIYFDPEGQFVDEAYDILYYLKIYDDVGIDTKKSGQLTRLVNEGKKFLDNGAYAKACARFEKAIEIDPQLISPRNDLSLAYFLNGESEKAISLAKSVFRLEPGNMFANCNLTVFYAQTRKTGLCKKQLDILSNLEIKNRDELLKLVHTYIILREHAGIVKALKGCTEDYREPAFMQMLSIAFYNMKRYDDAEKTWNAMKESYPQLGIAIDYFAGINKGTRIGVRQHNGMEYTIKLPEWLNAEYVNKLNIYMQMGNQSFLKSWENDGVVKSIVIYYLYTGSSDTKMKIAEKLAQTNNGNCRQVLENAVNSDNMENEAREYIFRLLGEYGSRYGKINAGMTSRNNVGNPKAEEIMWRKEWEAVIDCALQKKEYIYKNSYKNELKNIWMNFISRTYPNDMPVIKKREIWAAALEYIYCNLHLIRVSKRKLAEKYNISLSSITNKIRDLSK